MKLAWNTCSSSKPECMLRYVYRFLRPPEGTRWSMTVLTSSSHRAGQGVSQDHFGSLIHHMVLEITLGSHFMLRSHFSEDSVMIREEKKKNRQTYFLDGGAGLLTFTHTINKRRGTKMPFLFLLANLFSKFFMSRPCMGSVGRVALFFLFVLLQLLYSFFAKKNCLCFCKIWYFLLCLNVV